MLSVIKKNGKFCVTYNNKIIKRYLLEKDAYNHIDKYGSLYNYYANGVGESTIQSNKIIIYAK